VEKDESNTLRWEMANILVRCEVGRGLFKTEYLVSVPPNSPGASFYVDREEVQVNKTPEKGESVPGKVVAYLIEYRDSNAVIEMTGTPVSGGTRISVPRTITEAA
jgi:hypothetical protein